jgi:hypothetical protein
MGDATEVSNGALLANNKCGDPVRGREDFELLLAELEKRLAAKAENRP